MNLIAPDTGLLFWMVLIFGIVFFILAKWGFPAITGMVDKRHEHTEQKREAKHDKFPARERFRVVFHDGSRFLVQFAKHELVTLDGPTQLYAQ